MKNVLTLHKLCAVHWRVCSTSGGCAVQTKHTINKDTGVQYISGTRHQFGGGTSPILMWVCSTEEAHHQYRCGYAVGRRHTVSTDMAVQDRSVTSSVWTRVCSTGPPKLLCACSGRFWWLYLCGSMIFYSQSHYNLDFILCGCIKILPRSLLHANMITF